MNEVVPALALPIAATAAALLVMLGELFLSRRNEHALRTRGAVEPRNDVHRTMAWVYPLSFVFAGAEGALSGRIPGATTLVGLALFAAAKALKYWAIRSLGPRWTFRVLVPPGAPLVTRGPYRWLRHPNYVAVLGELAGFAMLVGGPVTGCLSVAAFSFLLWRRIQVEEQALGVSR
jgi:methyltransferase